MAEGIPPALQEFEVLSQLMQTVPHKSHKGIFTQQDVEWTCLDVTTDFVAIGTNVGVVYLYGRKKNTVQKLQCPGKKAIVSYVEMQESVDYVVAVATTSGLLFIFLLPSILPGRSKQLQMFTVQGMHHSAVTYVRWSQNAMKVFSGDDDGVVICTELDYQGYTSTSYLVCKEPHRIVQLDYAYRALLVSTRFRSFLITPGDCNSIVQVGQKDRKSLGPFGAVFLPGIPQAKDAVLFASRPGLRLWKANMDAIVQATYVFRELLTGTESGIAVLPDTTRNVQPSKPEDHQFGLLHIYGDTQLVSYRRSCLLITDPGLGTFVGYHCNLGPILDVAVCGDEIFILRDTPERMLLRLARKSLHDTAPADAANPADPINILSITATKMSTSIVGAFKDIGGKISSIQEGQKDSGKVPPWGPAENGREEFLAKTMVEEVDSAKEPSSESDGITPTLTPSEHQPPQLLESCAGKEKDVVPPAAPPIVKLEENELLKLEISYTPEAGAKTENSPPRGKDSTSPGLQGQKFESLAQEGFDDIVFSSSTKKKHKKKKHRGKDRDSTSIASLDISDQADQVRCRSPRARSPQSLSPGTKSPLTTRSLQGSSVGATLPQTVNLEDSTHPSSQPASPTHLAPGAASLSGSSEVAENTVHRTKGAVKAESTLSSTPPPASTEEDTSVTGSGNCGGAVSDAQCTMHEDPSIEGPGDTIATVALELALTFGRAKAEHPGGPGQSDSNSYSETGMLINESAKPRSVKSKPIVMNLDECLIDAEKGTQKTSVRTAGQASGSQQSSTTSALPEQPGISSEAEAELPCSLSPTEDFYSIYNSDMAPSLHTTSKQTSSIQDTLHSSASSVRKEVSSTLPEDLEYSLLDTWGEFPAPSSLCSLCISETTIWCTDRADNLYYSSLLDSSLKWKKVEDAPARQISASDSGWLVWRLYKGSVFVGTKLTTNRLSTKTKWMEVAREVAHICVDETYAWYAKENGEVFMQKGLSRDRPCYRSLRVEAPQKVVQVVCRQSVVWALTEDRNVLVRVGIEPGQEEGTDWKFLQGSGPTLLVSGFDLGDGNTAWVIDLVGRVWFTTSVSRETPEGSGQWWQVTMSEYLMQDSKALGLLKTVSSAPKNVVKLVQSQDKGGLISAGKNGIWVCPGHRATLHVCRSSVLGHQWDIVVPHGMLPSSVWNQISATATDEQEGLIWAQQPHGGTFSFLPSSLRPTEVVPPEPGLAFLSLSATEEAVWGVLPQGKVAVRSGMAPHCQHGLKWELQNLQQLGTSTLVHADCGSQNVWAVDSRGQVYLRIGVKPVALQGLSPAWVPAEGSTNSYRAKFTQVYSGANDWMVWAVDSKKCIYVRQGITDAMPIGTHWAYVPGSTVETLTVSERMVYALNDHGELLVRHGITPDNPAGNYWRKIPGALAKISVGAGDTLWGINKDGQLCRRLTYYLKRHHALPGLDKSETTVGKLGDEWELI